MEKFYFLFLLISLALVVPSCTESSSMPLLPDNVILELEWIQDIIDNCKGDCCTCTTDIYKGVWEDDSISFTITAGPLCDNNFVRNIRNNQGDILKTYNHSNREKFDEEVTEQIRIFDCE